MGRWVRGPQLLLLRLKWAPKPKVQARKGEKRVLPQKCLAKG